MLEAGIAQLLLANAGVQAAVGSNVFPVALPDSFLTGASTGGAITYRVISTVPDYVLSGPYGYVKCRIELNAWGATYATVKAISAAIDAAIDNYSGTLSDGTVVQAVTQAGGATDSFDQDLRLYRVQGDYFIIFSR